MTRTFAITARATVPHATLGETLGVLANVIVPILAQGVIIRRPSVVGLAQQLDLNRRAVRYVQRLRNKFTPDLWLHDRADDHWPLIPFSAGPAVCPGKNLVLMVSSAMLSAVLADRAVWL